ncbi:MAG: aminotransferase class V-fold PLP-dependent enzyme, partial [Planctomycetaceae bacterium]|nr:aminotransferase class V-fold PLP-dependent enzyme [Planctomycetaceae bacterium]
VLGAEPGEIYFTSGGTESDNWAIKGTGKRHIVSTAIEHYAVLKPLETLKRQGIDITLLDVDETGIVRPEQLTDALRDDTGLVSVMFANNETGTVQPVKEIGRICQERKIPFHSDAVQALGQIPFNLKELPVDLLSLSGHKIHAAKGIGILYIRRGTLINPLLDGGAQERGRRAGTENTAAVAGLAVAVEEAVNGIEERSEYLHKIRERFLDGVLQIKGTHLNGDKNRRLPGNANVRFNGIEGESLVLMLDKHGICCSTGSACTSGSMDASRVLLAMGLSMEQARSSLRFTFSEENTEDEIDFIVKTLEQSVRKLRSTLTIAGCCCPDGCC